MITAGPTREAIDPVRAITNLSSGKMGYAIADVAAGRGAHVTLISGPVALKAPEGVHVVPVKSAVEMGQALEQALGPNLDRADALIMAAAVSDYRPATPSAQKLKKGDGVLRLELTPNPDLLADIGARRTTLRPVLIGFALETAEGDALIGLGRKKLIDKCVDMVVANGARDSVEGDQSLAFLVSPLDCTPLPRMSKARIGARIIGWLEQRLLTPQTQETTQ